MKSTFLLLSFLIILSFFTTAQQTNRSYAITGRDDNNFFWADIKQVDLVSGKVVKTLFEANKTPFKINSTEKNADAKTLPSTTNPTGFGVAACAFDAAHNRLYFAPIHFSSIHYLDLNETDASFTTIKTGLFPAPAAGGLQTEENQITRMAFASDGYGYALTNDANHLVRFSTGGRPVIEDLGALIDASENQGISIHNKCSSWGGDMVADAFGRLVVVTASHNIFTIDLTTKTAKFTGTITGLPGTFSTNGAAVSDDGAMIVSSANVFDGLYKVNMKDLSATKIAGNEKPFNASDLANGNFLLQKEADAAGNLQLSKASLPLATVSDARIFPNPVKGSTFRLLMEGQEAGNYTITLSDLAGRILQSKVVNLTTATQTSTITFEKHQPKGMYVVHVIDQHKKITFSEKLVLE